MNYLAGGAVGIQAKLSEITLWALGGRVEEWRALGL